MAKKQEHKQTEHSHAHSHNDGGQVHHTQEKHFHDINPKAAGMALGIFFGGSMVILAIISYVLNWGSAMVRMLGSLYLGYDVTLAGVFLGLVWGFVDGFLTGYIFAWLYNKIGRCTL